MTNLLRESYHAAMRKGCRFMKGVANLRGLVAGLGLLMATAGVARADLARDYSAVPVNSWYPAYYLSYTETQAAHGGQRIDSLANLFRLTQTIDVFGRCGGWNVIIPYEQLNLAAAGRDKFHQDGAGDPKFVFDVNLFGAPAFSKAAFSNYVVQTYSSFHLSLTAPLGQYNRDAPANVGSSRWTLTPEVNFSYTPNRGESWLEFYFKPTFYTSTDEYARDQRMSQDPSVDLEGHASQNLGRRFWVAADLYYNFGGETAVNGAWQENRDSTLSGGVSANFTPWRHGRILLNYKDTLIKPSNASDSYTLMLYVAQLF